MSIRYALPCDACGRRHPVETSQAGGQIDCECGATIRIPTMLKIKRLDPWEDADAETPKETQEAPATERRSVEARDEEAPVTTPVAPSTSETTPDSPAAPKARKLSARRRGLFIVASLAFVVSVFFCARAIKTPPPIAVFYKQTVYDLGDGRKIRRDTTPTTYGDYCFYFFTDYSDPERPTYLVDDQLIDMMNPFVTIQYFTYLKELPMSDNFYENYEALKTRRYLYLGGFGFLAFVSLVVALLALFVKESQKQVGSMRGSSWNA